MGKKRRKRLSPEKWAEIKAKSDKTLERLQERIDYHTAKLREEHGPHYRIPTLEERIAYHEAKLREESRPRKRRWLRVLRPSQPS